MKSIFMNSNQKYVWVSEGLMSEKWDFCRNSVLDGGLEAVLDGQCYLKQNTSGLTRAQETILVFIYTSLSQEFFKPVNDLG